MSVEQGVEAEAKAKEDKLSKAEILKIDRSKRGDSDRGPIEAALVAADQGQKRYFRSKRGREFALSGKLSMCVRCKR